jgi:hypothetical protein
MATLAKNIRGLNAAQVVSKVRFIEERMKNNPAYPEPTPTLGDIATAREALEAAITAAKDGGRTATAIRRARQRELILLLNQLGGYVSSIAEGNALAILSSGFEVKRTGSPAGEPEPTRDLQAMISAFKGRVDLRWKPVKDAIAYHIHVSRNEPTDDTSWELAGVSTRASFKVTGLESARTYWFRVAAIGTTGMGPLGEVAHSLVR